MSAGRPSTYTVELAEAICLRIAEGESLIDILKDDGMPGYSTVSRWRRENEAFRAMYACAREDQADLEAEEIKTIADETPELVEIKDRDGNVVELTISSAWVAWTRNRIDVRKWRAAKHRPKVYGDKLELDAKVSVGDAIIERLARAQQRGDDDAEKG